MIAFDADRNKKEVTITMEDDEGEKVTVTMSIDDFCVFTISAFKFGLMLQETNPAQENT